MLQVMGIYVDDPFSTNIAIILPVRNFPTVFLESLRDLYIIATDPWWQILQKKSHLSVPIQHLVMFSCPIRQYIIYYIVKFQ